MKSASTIKKDYPEVWDMGFGLAQANWFIDLMDESKERSKSGKFEDALREFRKVYAEIDDGMSGKKWVLKPHEKNPQGEWMLPPMLKVIEKKTHKMRMVPRRCEHGQFRE